MAYRLIRYPHCGCGGWKWRYRVLAKMGKKSALRAGGQPAGSTSLRFLLRAFLLPSLLLALHCYFFRQSESRVHWKITSFALEAGSYYCTLSNRHTIITMRRSWAARLAVTIAAGQLYFSATIAQDTLRTTSDNIRSSSATPTVSGSVESPTATPTSSGEPTVHSIKAGAGGFKFTPQELHNVSVGDIVQWEFYPPDHSVARAEFGSACVPYEYTGKDKVGFWSETQWVNNTNEVCLSVSKWPSYANSHAAHILQRYDQFDRTHLLLLRSTEFVSGGAHGGRYQPELYTNSGIASPSGGRSRLPSSTRRTDSCGSVIDAV
jgi:plastocyanin